MTQLRNFGRWVAAGAVAVTKRRKPRRAALATATVAALAVAFGIGAHNWANAAPTSPSAPTAPKHAVPADPAKDVIPNSYIVKLKGKSGGSAAVKAAAAGMTRDFGVTVDRTFGTALNGFSAHMSAAQAKAMAARPEVAKVEPNRVVHASDTVSTPLWNLDRVDEPHFPLDNAYTFPVSATGVHAYVLDTGIHIQHPAFGGRASYGVNEVQPGVDPDDCDRDPDTGALIGHGTHVAGTIGGTGFGVAPGVQLVAVKVLGWDNEHNVPVCTGEGNIDQVIAGVNWVTEHAVKPAVANMSLGGGHDDLLDEAVANSIASGITYSVAAGNSGFDACGFSPADVPGAITVGATDQGDHRPFFSNFGPCVDIFAPGVGVVSALNADSGSHALDGTSMASPHVAGAAAMILAANPTFTPQQVQDLLVSRAVTGAIENPGLRSPNKLLQIEASTPSFAPLTVRLRAHANNLVVNADGSGSTLIANRLVNGAWEEFDVFDAGDGLVSLRSHANGRYVSADLNIGGKLINNRTAVGFWEKFTLSTNADGSVSLKANSNKKFVTAENFGNAPLVANRDSIGYWEQFDVAVASSQIVITSWINPKRPVATSADLSKGAKLIANRTEIGPWEVFDVADLGGGQVALRAHANNMVVTADLNNGGTLTANRTVVGPWEKFQIVYDAPTNDPPLRSVNLKANANGKFVSTDFNLGGTLIANRGAASFWESVVILAD